MDTITLKDLHQHTGKFARAARDNPVLITDRGHLVAMLSSPVTAALETTLPRRFTMRSLVVPRCKGDSTATVSAGRDDR